MTRSPAETIRLGKTIARKLKPNDRIYLYGELGSGKTTLAKGIGAGLEVKEEITSPSFVIVTNYQGKFPVCHIDLYRLQPSDIASLPIEEYFIKNGITIIEWAERLPSPINQGLKVFLKIKGKNNREISIENLGD